LRVYSCRCDEMYEKECSDATMPFYRSMYDRSTGQSPNMPREQVSHLWSRSVGDLREDQGPWGRSVTAQQSVTLTVSKSVISG
jgi:hypothetical protein